MSEARAVARIEGDPWGVILPPFADEPRFPEPYLSLYRKLVEDAEEEIAILPGAGTISRMLIRKIARDYIAGLMADRQDSIDLEIRCRGCGATLTHPFWPHKDSRMMQGFRQLLDQIKAADLSAAVRTEFVLDLAVQTLALMDGAVEDDELRVELKERIRGTYQKVLEQHNERRVKDRGPRL